MTAMADAFAQARRLTRKEKYAQKHKNQVSALKAKSPFQNVTLPPDWHESLVMAAIRLDVSKIKPIDKQYDWDTDAKPVRPQWGTIRGKSANASQT